MRDAGENDEDTCCMVVGGGSLEEGLCVMEHWVQSDIMPGLGKYSTNTSGGYGQLFTYMCS